MSDLAYDESTLDLLGEGGGGKERKKNRTKLSIGGFFSFFSSSSFKTDAMASRVAALRLKAKSRGAYSQPFSTPINGRR